jgi:CHAT domain-containing protein/tetratricopeptide (TPR) repeat protein
VLCRSCKMRNRLCNINTDNIEGCMQQAKRAKIFFCLPLVAMLLAAIPARAQTPEAAEINSLVREVDALYAQGHYSDASERTERIVKAAERLLGRDDTFTLTAVNNLAELYREQGRYSEAEPLYRRALGSMERIFGNEHRNVLAIISNIAGLFQDQGRLEEAEPLYRRVLEARERTLGRDHPETLISLDNLGALYLGQRRYDEAEPLFRLWLETSQRVLGAEARDTLLSLNNLAALYQKQRRYDQAEPLYKRSLEARERTLGKEHPDTQTSLNNLAKLYEAQGRYSEAEPLYLMALRSLEQVLDKGHPRTVATIGNLGIVHFSQRDWAGAANFWGKGTAAVIERTRRGALAGGLTGRTESEAEQWNWQFWGLAKAVFRQTIGSRASERASASRAMFQTAQWAHGSVVAQSLAKMAAHSAAGTPALSALARERQDLVVEWQKRDGARNLALGETLVRRNARAEAENLARLSAIESRIAEIDKKLTAEFPDYAALVYPLPLSVEQVQSQLSPNEVLILFLDTDDRFTPTPEETFIWTVTKTEVRWLRSDLGTAALTRDVQALRCGLNEEEWGTATQARRCADLLGLNEIPDPSRPLPFNLDKAHALYQGLFGQAEDLIKGKRLIIVPSGPLTSVPFNVLVTQKPRAALPDTFEGYRRVAWLGRSNAIVTLPAVSSLKALRLRGSGGPKAAGDYAGYGDPLLAGDGASCKSSKAPDICPAVALAQQRIARISNPRATVRGRGGRRSANATTDEVFAKGMTADSVLQQVRSLCPLPDTAYEIQCVAEHFKGKSRLIRLEGEAREADIKALSASGKLANYGVLHFATHGLLSGDVERMAQRRGEPALVLTPPERPADVDDDGLLTASEVAALKLNADWVVLSACNTAAGDKVGAEALSGLARAFFYAGARALLVSHWPVYSDAAVRLTTRAFAELQIRPNGGRAEALQRAMSDLMDDRSQNDNAHPAVWAPFVVVGEGGR